MPLTLSVPQKLDPMRLLFGHLDKIPRRHLTLTRGFVRKIPIEIIRGNYLIKTVETVEELERVLQLRYQIFRREFQGRWCPYGSDWEYLDPMADHLVILDRRTHQMVGAYRLLASTFSENFYSANEFVLDDLLAKPGVKLELSRAGILKGHRNGVIIGLLWRGISEYLKKIDASYVFGCASIKTLDAGEVRSIQDFLVKNELVLQEDAVVPTPEYQHRLNFTNSRAKLSESEIIPPLFQSYLRAGARVACHPAWDYEFRCVDFLTVLDVTAMTKEFRRRYR